jgi:hypothetical protein
MRNMGATTYDSGGSNFYLSPDVTHPIFVREEASMNSHASMFDLHGFSIVNLTNDVETGAADEYVSSDTLISFVGIQATRAAAQKSDGFCQINKSKEYIINQVCNLGFMFFALLFLEDECRGILFLSPEDEALIRSLPAFEKSFSIGLGKNGIRTKAFVKNSVAAKFFKS